MNAKRLSALLVTGLPLVYAGCGGDNLTLPSEGEPAAISVVDGSGQIGRVGLELSKALIVLVTDTQDRPVAGATVEFVLDDPAAGGSASPPSSVTGPDGQASSRITLGTQVGPVTGHARVPVPEGTVPVETPFTATAVSSDAYGIAAVSGDQQSGPVGTQLGAPLVVRVTDGFGNPIPGVTIEWSVTGGGSVSQSPTQTDENGQASVTRTLGNTAGPQTTLATAAGLAGSPVTFTHTATAGAASRVEKVSGDGQSGPPGSELPNPLVVQVLDAENNPIVGRAVEWVIAEGGGTPTPGRSTTDDQGRASTRWTLGPTAGTNRLNAVVSGVGVGRIEFTATAQKASSSTSITSIQPDQSSVGQEVTVAFSVSGSGGTPTGNVTVNGGSVAQPCTASLSSGSGSCRITFTAPGNHRVTATYSGDARFNGSSDEENHQVNAAPNSPPSAVPDAYSTNEDATLNVNATEGVLANDTDPEGDPLTAVKDSDPAHGTLTLNSDGSFSYTPAADYFGSDSFTYHANAGAGSSASVTVSITVNPVNDAPSFTGGGNVSSFFSEGTKTVDWATNISGGPNESDEILIFDVTSNSNEALFSAGPAVSPDGRLTYTPATTGTATVTVVLRDDSNGLSDPHTFTITVDP